MSNNTMLTKEQILGAKDLEVIEVEVPEWNGKVCLRKFSGKVREKFIFSYYDENGNKVGEIRGIQGRLLALCLCDEEGTLLFSEEEVDSLMEKSSVVLDRLFQKASELNGIGEQQIKELEKN